MTQIQTADSPASTPVNITDLRRRLGRGGEPISQGALGELLGGVDQSTVSRWETKGAPTRGPAAAQLRRLDEETPEPEATSTQ